MAEQEAQAAQQTQTQGGSHDAAVRFKSQITDSLPLLESLNDEDKTDIWKFWKTVTSAVKIAVSGKGDILKTKTAEFSFKKLVGEQNVQQQDGKNAVSLYLPVKSLKKGTRRYRILKLAKRQKIADCINTLNSEGEKPVFQLVGSENNIEYCDLQEWCSSSSKAAAALNEKVSVQQTEHEGHGRIDLQAVSHLLQTVHLQEPVSSSQPSLDHIEHLDVSKNMQNVWSIRRPPKTHPVARVIKDTIIPVNKSSCISYKKYHSKRGPALKEKVPPTIDGIGVDNLTLFPSIKQEVSDDKMFKVTIIPVESNGLNEVSCSFVPNHENQNNGCSSELQLEAPDSCVAAKDKLSSDKIGNDSVLLPYRIHVSLPEEAAGVQIDDLEGCADFQTQSSSIADDQEHCQEFPIPEEVLSFESGEQNHDLITVANGNPRNASDIETIISALEDELKKTSSDIASLSVTLSNEDISDASKPTIQLIQGEDVVEVQKMGDVVWAHDGEVQVVDAEQIMSQVDSEETGMVYVQPESEQYDVVECEVLTDKIFKERKKKPATKIGNKVEKISLAECPMCHRVLNYSSSMAAHMRIHTGVRPYSCGQCDRKFTTKANRDRHEATHVGLKPFQCSQCKKSFTEKRSLKIHMRTHTGERPFTCEICGQSFTQKCSLVVHMDLHANKKSHACTLCDKAFRQKCQLDIHLKRHNRQALHPCTICSFRCYTKGDLARHMIKHTGEKPFKCELCTRAFTRRQYLVDHENQHYGRKPYRCSACSATFHDMGSCHRHVRKHEMEVRSLYNREETHSTLLSSKDFDRILEGTQVGQVIRLHDGTDALVKAVVSEEDGSTVYHITHLSSYNDKGDNSSETPDNPVEVSAAESDITDIKLEDV